MDRDREFYFRLTNCGFRLNMAGKQKYLVEPHSSIAIGKKYISSISLITRRTSKPPLID